MGAYYIVRLRKRGEKTRTGRGEGKNLTCSDGLFFVTGREREGNFFVKRVDGGSWGRIGKGSFNPKIRK